MRIAFISDCETNGGAAVAATRLATELAKRGHEITRIVARTDPAAERHWRTVAIAAPYRVPTRLTTPRVAWLGGALWSRRSERLLERALAEVQPEVVSIHNLHNAVTSGWSPRFAEISARFAPAAWTLHDLWSFTGRCALASDCRKFIDGCDAECPTPNEYPSYPRKHIAGQWELRRTVLNDQQIVAVTPSKWLAGLASQGLWRGHRIEVIANGVDVEVFRPEDRARARRDLGINVDQRVVLSVVPDFRDRQKGGALLADALRAMPRDGSLLLTAGRHPESVDWSGVNVRHLGWLHGAAAKVAAYNAADILAQPSLAENLPTVIIESIACGTPAVAFDVGGTKEIVRDEETG